MREIAQTLARLGLVKVKKGDRLNVRRRERVRRNLAKAGRSLGWAQVAALSPDPVRVVSKDVKKIVRKGVRSLKREVEQEIEEKETESVRLEQLVQTVHELAENPKAEYPTEINYRRTAKSPVDGLVTRSETLVLADQEEAARAAKKVEKSLKRWEKHRLAMVEELQTTRNRLGELSSSLTEVIEDWQGLLRDVLVTMP